MIELLLTGILAILFVNFLFYVINSICPDVWKVFDPDSLIIPMVIVLTMIIIAVGSAVYFGLGYIEK